MILFYFSGCFNDGMMTAVHEMMHTLGFVHEHTRPDRCVFLYALGKTSRTKSSVFFFTLFKAGGGDQTHL